MPGEITGMETRKIAFCTIFLSLLLPEFKSVTAQTAPSGKYLNLNGKNQFMSVTSCPDLNISRGESLTLTCRLSADNFDDNYSILSKGHLLAGGSWYELSTYRNPTGPNLGFNLRNSDNIDLGAPYFGRLEPGTWYHVAWVYNPADKTSRVYLNGVLARTVINGAILRSSVENDRDLAVGCSWDESGLPVPFQYWAGNIDEIRIWKRALTPDEIRADQTASQASPNELVAAYNFENITTGNVPDVSGRGHIARLHGYGIRMVKTLRPLGQGSTDEPLVGFGINGSSKPVTITSIAVNLSGTTDIRDIRMIKIYYNGSRERPDLSTAVLFGQSVPGQSKTVIKGNLTLSNTDNYFWVTADISPDAPEGHQVESSVLSYQVSDQEAVVVPQMKGNRIILLTSHLLFSGGDGGSKHYRIPAIVTARDGSLVVACDKRWNNSNDLPGHIDVVTRRSTDMGQTWSDPVTLAGEGINTGFGDPALVLNNRNGEIICLFAGTQGFFSSTASYPIRIFQTKSSNNGLSWNPPIDLTPQIYGIESSNPLTQKWQGAFVTSGAALQLRNGRLMAVMPVREDATRNISNYVLYSDDNARNWKVAPSRAAVNGNEAKMVELNSGRILMSIRNDGGRLFTLSKDQGMNWVTPWLQTSISDPGCNGDLIRYTSTNDGYDRNRLLHSIPYATFRGNVSVLLSYDEGKTWPVRRTIYSGPSAYSSLCVLPDGTIGIFYEVGEYESYQMYFTRFSLEWLSEGTDTYSGKWRTGSYSGTDLVSAQGELSLYPNPATDYLLVKGLPPTPASISIISLEGSLVKEIRVEEPAGEVSIPLDGLKPGIYLLKVGQKTEKFVIR
jgi:hypothetical protein